MAFLTAHVQLLRRAAGSTRTGTRSSTSRHGRTRCSFYVDLMKDDGPPGASSNGFNENLALFQQGKCGMWIDATVAASFVTDPKRLDGRRQGRLRARARTTASASAATGSGPGRWPFPPARKKADAAKKFIAWATSKDYIELVASKEGWANVPPGHPHLALREPGVPEGGAVRQDDARLRSTRPTRRIRRSSRCPISACSSSRSPSSRAIGTAVGQLFSAALAGQIDGRRRARSRRRTLTDARDDARPATSSKRSSARSASAAPAPGRGGPSADRRADCADLQGDASWPPDRRTPLARCMMAPVGASCCSLWMIVPLAMTLYFSFQHYNLLDPERDELRRLRQLRLLPHRSRPSATPIVNTLLLVGRRARSSR